MEAVQSLTKKKDNMEGKFKLTTTFWKIKALEWKVLWLMQRASLVQMLMCRRSEQQGAGFLVYRMITKPSWLPCLSGFSDEIIAFGSVNTRNFQNLQNIASVVQHSEGKPLNVILIRNGQKTQMGLTPQQWSGRGLLGCNIVPIQK
ncbi:hypothetical protein J4Q44_G00233070 [Coregonus suidteri]|uniref:26S proteasome non-ATPase regulatory subunit 9 n=1 Tax=Coregonus suidteri TaxID=861788 RepID=A0AAN8QYI6_9TELE